MPSAVIVQARLGSSRLPGKVLMEICGKPVLTHVLERCKQIRGAAQVVCAAVRGPAGDAIAELARACGVHVYRGCEDDVLDRTVMAARDVGADVVLRVTSDCPAIDPGICDEVLALLEREGADYACNNQPPSLPHGLDCEAVRSRWLERAWREAARPSDREHVCPWIRRHPDARRVVLHGPGGDVVRHRWTLDTPDDLLALRRLFALLPDGFDWRRALAVAEAHPEIAALNAGHDRLAGYRASLERDRAAGFAVDPRQADAY